MLWQVSRIFIDEKNSNSSSLLVEWEIPAAGATRFEYLPSYCAVASDGPAAGGKAWTNATAWTELNEMRLSNLTSFTQYNVTVYVRVKSSPAVVYPPALYVSAHTKMGAPSAPWNVTVKQLSHAEVQINWNAPARQLSSI